MLDAGRLNKRITIERRATTKGSRGQSIGDWSTLRTVSAEVKPTGGQEIERGRQQTTEAQYLITIRKPRSIVVTERDRIQYDGRTLGIGSIIEPLENDEYLELTCAESFNRDETP